MNEIIKKYAEENGFEEVCNSFNVYVYWNQATHEVFESYCCNETIKYKNNGVEIPGIKTLEQLDFLRNYITKMQES